MRLGVTSIIIYTLEAAWRHALKAGSSWLIWVGASDYNPDEYCKLERLVGDTPLYNMYM